MCRRPLILLSSEIISTAPTDDKLKNPVACKQAWQEIIKAGADVIESDLPIEVAALISSLVPVESANLQYFGESDL